MRLVLKVVCHCGGRTGAQLSQSPLPRPGRRCRPRERVVMGRGQTKRSRRPWRDSEMDWLWRMGDAVQGDAFIVWPGWTAVPSLWPEERGAVGCCALKNPPRGKL